MTGLAQHIELLLLENDCVVVPDFGGFVAHYAPARRINDEQIFLPPVRIVGFNPKLTMNDRLLAQSYMKEHNVSFSDAGKMLKKEVEQLASCLQEKGKVDLPHIGEIHRAIHGIYEFIPYDDKIVTPYLFGLEPFEIKELSELTSKDYGKNQSGAHISFFRYAVAMAAAVFFFFFLSPSIENTTVSEKNYARLFCSDIFDHSPVQKEIKKTIIAEKTPEAIQAEDKEVEIEVVAPPRPKHIVESKTNAPASSEKKAAVKTKRYHIITSLADNIRITQKDIMTLKQEGCFNAKVINIDGVKCVSVMSFSTHDDAYRKLLLLRRMKSCENAWIMPARI
ncbi:hypothetical protein EZS27_020541 [termite gut metagenome]|uniref:SPOR domain-containing protein n=1 Tax=termite gut metagenome TaxID=433724 RepID=A0A5J4RB55_9ZZZZ